MKTIYSLITIMIFTLSSNLHGQSTFDIVTTTPTTITGNVTTSPGSIYSLTRTSQNGFTGTVTYNIGIASGLDAQNNTLLGNGPAPDPQGIDQFTYNFNVTPGAGCIVGSVILTRSVVTTGGTAEWGDFTITWPGGGNAVLSDPSNLFTSHVDGALLASGTVLTHRGFGPPSIGNIFNTLDDWMITIPGNSITVNVNSVQPAPNPNDMMYSEWIAFDANLSCALPVVLSKFEAYAVSESSVKAYWETSSEQNCDYFLIEKSIDGEQWETVAKVNGHGNSQTTQSYSVIDPDAFSGISYYRLIQVDFNGARTNYPLESVLMGMRNKGIVQVSPNPFSSVFKLKGEQSQLSNFGVLNAFGQNVKSFVHITIIDTTTIEVDAQNLPSGTYMLVTVSGNYKLVKE